MDNLKTEPEYYIYYYIPFTHCSIAGNILTVFYIDSSNPVSDESLIEHWMSNCCRSSICHKEGFDCWLACGTGLPFMPDEMIEHVKKKGTRIISSVEHLNVPAILLDYLKSGFFENDKVLAALTGETGKEFQKIEEWEEFLKN